ncbi:MAG: GNAT family N-acetyltransferase [Planctomycetota bacterium]
MNAHDPELELRSERLLLRLPDPDEAPVVADYLRRNRRHHAPWSPPWPEHYFSDEHWGAQLERNRGELRRDESLRLFVFERGAAAGPARGHLSFTRFIRGPFQACLLGYALDQEVVGRGYMGEAIGRGLEHVFRELGLHRVEANYVPTNLRSGAVLRRLGFQIMGYARDYLFIDGAWRDHVLTAITNPDPRPPSWVPT